MESQHTDGDSAGQSLAISLWIDQLRDSNDLAARLVWEHFANRLFAIASAKIRSHSRRVYDAEDALQSMFHSICSGLAEGRFPDLTDRTSLWRLMLVITNQKIANRLRFDQQQRRDIRRTLTDSVFIQREVIGAGSIDDLMLSREPTPEFAAEFHETCGTLFDRLKDPVLEQVVALRLEGFTDSEIAEKMDCSRRTVQRRLEIVRRHLMSMESPSG